ncbi:MAG: hypothetical protein ACRDJI_04585 [Actinomycetota bacterium]
MRPVRLLTAAALLAGSLASPAGAGPKLKTLGTDPAGDAPPALDITYLQVGRTGDDLVIRIGISGMLPQTGGYPTLPGIEWVFDVGSRTFIAEAVAGTSRPAFYLFEMKDDAFEQLESPEGTYDSADGYASILVPLETIGATSGTKISGTGPKGTDDVDAHVHLGPQTYYADAMASSKDYVVP